MAPHERAANQSDMKRLTMSIIFIIIGIGVCTTTWITVVDLTCRQDIDRWMPVYPDSQLVRIEQSGSYRLRATGVTEVLYRTEDDRQTVARWYRDYRREITSSNPSQGGSERAARGIAMTRYNVYEDQEQGGTYIYQYSECARA